MPESNSICSRNLVSSRDALALMMELTGQNIEARVNPIFVRANQVLKLGGDSRDPLTW